MREDARIEAHKHHLIERGAGSGSDADGESESEEEWNTVEGTTVTADGDIIPTPSSAKKKGESSRVGDRAAEREALVAGKRELSD